MTALRVRAMREDRGRFAALRGARVLIYWPHGLGDWIHFGVVAPLLEPTNAYAITRFGDDYVSLMEGNAYVRPILSGVRALGDGSSAGTRHLGLELRRCGGQSVELQLPAPLDEATIGFAPTVVLWTDYPETEGRTPYPFHTKARNLARLLVRRERLEHVDLSAPLANSIDFTPPAALQLRIDERLRSFLPAGSRLGIVSRSGVTAARKNWGDGSEARAFVRAMRDGARPWRFISMDGDDLGENAVAFARLFGDMEEPFARLYKGVVSRADLFVGIPAGPLHFTMARGNVPTVGLWVAHHPDWYDEPNPNAIHLIGGYVRERGFDRRPATTTKPPALRHRLVYLDTAAVDAVAVVDAWRTLR